jgi:serine/threonine protein phosphatase PrpC
VEEAGVQRSSCSPDLGSRARLVVGSDGLFNCVARDKIAEAVRSHGPADAAEGLRAVVQLPSGMYQDDLGLVVVHRSSSV